MNQWMILDQINDDFWSLINKSINSNREKSCFLLLLFESLKSFLKLLLTAELIM